MKKLLILCLLPITAAASDASLYCEMVRAQAQPQLELLTAPEAFASVGNTGAATNTITVGLRKSFSKAQQAVTAERLVDAHCRVFEAQQHLDRGVSGLSARAELAGLYAKVAPMAAALKLAEESLQVTNALRLVQNATIQELKTDSDQVSYLKKQIASTTQRVAFLESTEDLRDGFRTTALPDLLTAQMEVAILTAESTNASGWDVSVSVGAQQSLQQNGTVSGFIGVTAFRSLGLNRSKSATQASAMKTLQYLKESAAGPNQLFKRLRAFAENSKSLQATAVQQLTAKQENLSRLLDFLGVVNTPEAQKMLRTTHLELQLVIAERTGELKKLQFFDDWVAQNPTNDLEN